MITVESIQTVLNSLKWVVVQLALEYQDKEGYIQMRLNDDLTLDTKAVSFIEGPFDKEKYYFLGEPQTKFSTGTEPYDVISVYYAILWPNEEWFFIKEIIVLAN